MQCCILFLHLLYGGYRTNLHPETDLYDLREREVCLYPFCATGENLFYKRFLPRTPFSKNFIYGYELYLKIYIVLNAYKLPLIIKLVYRNGKTGFKSFFNESFSVKSRFGGNDLFEFRTGTGMTWGKHRTTVLIRLY